MVQYDVKKHVVVGSQGSLNVREDDEITRKLLMLIEGECEEVGPLQATSKFGYSKQRYFQLRVAFVQSGALGLHSQKRGPKTNYRRTSEVVRQVIRHCFLDPDASAQVVPQKLRQSGSTISTRSVERVMTEYGLQKKTLPVPPSASAGGDPDVPVPAKRTARKARASQRRTRRPPAAGR